MCKRVASWSLWMSLDCLFWIISWCMWASFSVKSKLQVWTCPILVAGRVSKLVRKKNGLTKHLCCNEGINHSSQVCALPVGLILSSMTDFSVQRQHIVLDINNFFFHVTSSTISCSSSTLECLNQMPPQWRDVIWWTVMWIFLQNEDSGFDIACNVTSHALWGLNMIRLHVQMTCGDVTFLFKFLPKRWSLECLWRHDTCPWQVHTVNKISGKQHTFLQSGCSSDLCSLAEWWVSHKVTESCLLGINKIIMLVCVGLCSFIFQHANMTKFWWLQCSRSQRPKDRMSPLWPLWLGGTWLGCNTLITTKTIDFVH